MSTIRKRVITLERDAQTGGVFECCWSMTGPDFDVLSGASGAVHDYLALLHAAGLDRLADGEEIAFWWIDVADDALGGPTAAHKASLPSTPGWLKGRVDQGLGLSFGTGAAG